MYVSGCVASGSFPTSGLMQYGCTWVSARSSNTADTAHGVFTLSLPSRRKVGSSSTRRTAPPRTLVVAAVCSCTEDLLLQKKRKELYCRLWTAPCSINLSPLIAVTRQREMSGWATRPLVEDRGSRSRVKGEGERSPLLVTATASLDR